MNPYDGYRLYQIERTKTRAEIIAEDAGRSGQAAAVFRGIRALVASRAAATGQRRSDGPALTELHGLPG
jgi:hypothetical protein